jgi:biofilm PGA synthesis lipoprotein PgaB
MKSVLFKALLEVRKAIYVSLGFVDRILQRQNPVFILTYHGINSDNWRFSVDQEVFKKHILYLKKQYEFITLSELAAYLEGKKKLARPSVVLTIDDGYKDILGMKDFLTKQNIRPTLFVLSDPSHVNDKEVGIKAAFLSAKEIKNLMKDGWEVGCHSATHANLVKIKNQKSKVKNDRRYGLEEEIMQSKKTLEKELGIAVPYFSYPRGKYTDGVLKTVKKAKYTLAVTMDDGLITRKTHPLLLPRVGIDRTHTFEEFKVTFLPSVVLLRNVIKKSFIGKYL